MVLRRFGKSPAWSVRFRLERSWVRDVVEELSIALDVSSTSSDNGREIRTSLDTSVFGVAAIEPEFDLSNTSLIEKTDIVEFSVATRAVNAYDV